MKNIYTLVLGLVVALTLSAPVMAADTAVFSAESSKTDYVVGDDIKVTLNVDAGTYVSTLSTIEMSVKISDPTVIDATSASPLTLGSIYSSVVSQSYASGVLKATVFIDPNNKPASRSGVIGTLSLKALKTGQATISYDGIQATEENNELEFISTSASSLTLNVGQGVAAATTSATATSTKTAVKATTTVSTGPEQFLLLALLGGALTFIFYSLLKSRTSGGRL